MKMDLDHLTYTINGAVFEVNRVLGAGFLEKVYENALLVELNKQVSRPNHKFRSRFPTRPGCWRNFADLTVDDQVIIELKTVAGYKKFTTRFTGFTPVLGGLTQFQIPERN